MPGRTCCRRSMTSTVGSSVASVTIIATVRNESATIEQLLSSMFAQHVLPAEIIIADAGSTDGTREHLRAWSERFPLLRVIEAPGAGRSAGRNLAIQAATSEWIACTDGGVLLDEHWLQALLRGVDEARAQGQPVDVVSGFFSLDARTVFELALGCVTLPDERELHTDRFLPSSRSVLFRKAAWQRAGGYPEWLDVCEDLLFDLELRKSGASFRFAGDALVHFRPRRSIGAYFWQYYTYARGDGKSLLWTFRHAVRYLTYASAVVLLLGALGGPRRKTILALSALAGAGIIYMRQPYIRLSSRRQSPMQASVVARAGALALLPTLRFIGDVAKMCGYPVGLAWRAQHRSPQQFMPRPGTASEQ